MHLANLVAAATTGRGQMPMRQIYANVKHLAKREHVKLSPYWKSTVRNTLQRHCRESLKYRKPNYFKHVKRGVWECRV